MVAVSAILEVVVVCADDARETATDDEPPKAPPRGLGNQSSLQKDNTGDYVKTVAQFRPAAVIPRTASSNRKDGTDKLTLHQLTNEQQNGFIRFYY